MAAATAVMTSMNRMVASSEMPHRSPPPTPYSTPATNTRIASLARDDWFAQERCAVRILVCVDDEAAGRISALGDVPHRHIGAFDMAPGSIGIEQRTCVAIAGELLPYCGDQRGIGRELQGQSFVFIETAGDEFGHAGGAEQACSHSTDETLSHAREHRQPDPKRVARRGMRIDRKIVEEEVGQAVTCQMLGYLRLWREHETRGIHG